MVNEEYTPGRQRWSLQGQPSSDVKLVENCKETV
jgi:hypothetical protein